MSGPYYPHNQYGAPPSGPGQYDGSQYNQQGYYPPPQGQYGQQGPPGYYQSGVGFTPLGVLRQNQDMHYLSSPQSCLVRLMPKDPWPKFNILLLCSLPMTLSYNTSHTTALPHHLLTITKLTTLRAVILLKEATKHTHQETRALLP